MLVVARKEGEEILIGEEIRVVVLRTSGGRVKLGIQAPEDTPIRRRELVDRDCWRPAVAEAQDHACRNEVPSATPPANQPMSFPTVPEILGVMREELPPAAGGSTFEILQDGSFLIRAVLPMAAEIRSGDVIRGGVALKVAADQIEVRHHVLRRVCRNGAIMSQTLAIRHIRRVALPAPDEVLADVVAQLRDALEACFSQRVFSSATELARKTAQTHAATAGLHAKMRRIPRNSAARLRTEIARRFVEDDDRWSLTM